MLVVAAAFLHLLVFVYWLGGDLGAFAASFAAVDARKAPEARRAALQLIADVDMAPRSALILALPTGVTLAALKGWLPLPGWSLAIAWIVGGAWLALAWRLHLAHAPPGAPERVIDLALRWVALAGLIAAGGAGLAGALPIPGFLASKLLLLAGAIALGLLIRVRLRPLGPALAALARCEPDADAAIAGVLARSRPLVVGIWLLISAAALLGLAKPA